MFWFKLKVWLTSGLKTNLFSFALFSFQGTTWFLKRRSLEATCLLYLVSFGVSSTFLNFFFQFLATDQGAYIIEGNSFVRLPYPLATCIMIHALERFVNNFFKKILKSCYTSTASWNRTHWKASCKTRSRIISIFFIRPLFQFCRRQNFLLAFSHRD